MAAAIYSTWLSNQSGEGGISHVHIEAVLVDFIVRISAQSFFWHAEFGVPVVQVKKAPTPTRVLVHYKDPFCRKSSGRRAASIANPI
jgi:hypothetical protein